MTQELMRPCAALAAYSEPLVDGRRVLVLCDSTSEVPELLLDRGARLVQVCDADQTRLSEAATRNASRNITFTPLPDKTLPVRDGAFDVAIVENLAALASPRDIVAKLRRALSAQGIAIIAAPNVDVSSRLMPEADERRSEAPSYYELYDLVAEHFEEVSMFGQTPFVGYALASFAPAGEPVPTIDTALVPGGAEEPEWFIAMASVRPAELEDFAVVQMPFEAALPETQTPDLEEQVRLARAAEQSAREQMADLEARLVALTEEAREAKPPEDSGRVAELEEELNRREAWIAQLESRAAAADARADEIEVELSRVRSRDRQPEPSNKEQELKDALDQASRRTKELETELQVLAADAKRADGLQSELAANQAKVTELNTSLDKSQARVAKLEAEFETMAALEREMEAGGVEDDTAQLERTLTERGQTIQRLTKEVREAERIGKELLAELEALRHASDPASATAEAANDDSADEASPATPAPVDDGAPPAIESLNSKLEELARINAEREADLEAARWSIEALETRLAGSGEPGVARELDEARAEVQRQAVLIEQLKDRRTTGGAR